MDFDPLRVGRVKRPAEAVAHTFSLVDVLLTVLLYGWAASELSPVPAALFDTVGIHAVAILSPVAVGAIYRLARSVGRSFGVPSSWQRAAFIPVTALFVTLGARNVWLLSRAGLPESYGWGEFGLTAVATAAVAVLVYRRTLGRLAADADRTDARHALRAAAVALLLVMSVVAPFANFGGTGPVGTAEAGDQTWTSAGSMAEDREGIGAASVGENIYIPGGADGSGNYFSSGIQIYNTSTDIWSSGAAINTPRRGHAVGSLNGYVYAIGGVDSNNNILNSAQRYNPQTDRWSSVSSPGEIKDAAAATVNDRLYIVGGLTSSSSATKQVKSYDPGSNSWSSESNYPIDIVGGAAASDGEYIYHFGGYDGTSFGWRNDAYRYDPETETWSSIADMPAAFNQHQATYVNGRIYITGGNNNGNVRSTTYRYNPNTDTYTQVESMSSARYWHGMAASGRELIVAGGNTGSGNIGSAESYTVPELTKASGYTKSDGSPEPNTTVVVNSINFDRLNGTIQEKKDRADEITATFQDTAPDAYLSEKDLDASSILSGDRVSGKYVAAHSPADWSINAQPAIDGTNIYSEQPVLGPQNAEDGPYVAANTAPAGEPIVLSIWDGSKGGLYQNNADEDLSGGTDSGTVVIEELGPGGELIDTSTRETNAKLSGRYVTKTHRYAQVSLQRGIYRIYPEENEASAYILAVGNPRGLVASWNDDLRTAKGTLTKQAQELREFRNNGTVENQKTVSNASGYWEVTLQNGAINSTEVIAYKGPAGIDTAPENLNESDIRDYFQNINLSDGTVAALQAGSVYLSDSTTAKTSGETNITLQEYSAPRYVGINRSQNLTEQLAGYFFNESFSDLDAVDQRYLRSLPRSKLGELYNKSVQQAEDSPDVLGFNPDNSPDPSELSEAELRERIRELQENITQLQNTIEASSNITERTDEYLTAEFQFGRALERDDVKVEAIYSNGTRRLVGDEYITVDQSVLGAVGEGSTTVTIDEYPRPNNNTAAVTFRTTVVDDGQVGGGEVTGRTPGFTGAIPGLRSVDFTSSTPGVGERVGVTVRGEQDSQFGGLQAVDVTGPEGQAVATNTTGRSATFTPDTAGDHTVEVIYSNGGGVNLTERLDIRVLRNDIDRPATVRAENGLTGPYAVTGSNLVGGQVQVKQAGAKTDVVALVGGNDDPPPTVHTHVETVDQPPTSTTCTQLATEPDETQVQQRITVLTHVGELSEDSYVYRVTDDSIHPISKDGNSHGSRSTSSNGTTISTYSDDEGEACVRVISNPDVFQTVNWQIQKFQEAAPSVPFNPFAEILFVLPAGSYLFSRRQREA